MRVSVEYMSLLREAAGTDAESIEIETDPLTLADLLEHLAAHHGNPFRDSVLDADNTMHPWLMVTINDTLHRDPAVLLREGDRVSLAVPISGG